MTWIAPWCPLASHRRLTWLAVCGGRFRYRRWASYCWAESCRQREKIIRPSWVSSTWLPVGETKSEELETGRSEQKVSVFLAQIREAGNFVTKRENDINRGGQQVIELGDPSSLYSDQSFFWVKILLINLYILQGNISLSLSHHHNIDKEACCVGIH